MGRRAQGGYEIFDRKGWFYVRFRHQGEQVRLGLGTKDRPEADTRAASEYAATLSGRRRKVARPVLLKGAGGGAVTLAEVMGEWIADQVGVLDVTTCETLTVYARHYVAFFGTLERMTTESCSDYTRARLRQVLRKTVVKEQTFLRGFFAWAVEQEFLSEAPTIEPPKKKATGVRSGPQRAKPVEIDRAQALAIIAGLPELSKSIGGRRWPLRARFLVAWETGLRPASLASLRVPENYRPGSAELVLDDEGDKARFGRTVPISAAAREALDRVAPPGGGLLFGDHEFAKVLKRTAEGVLGPVLARRFAQYDFRHGRGTDLIDAGASLTGVAYLLGHKHLTTTERYTHANRKAGARALAAGENEPTREPTPRAATAEASPIRAHGGEGRKAVAENLSDSGVTDEARTRDNWSHNAVETLFSAENSVDGLGRKGPKKPVLVPHASPLGSNDFAGAAKRNLAVVEAWDSWLDSALHVLDEDPEADAIVAGAGGR